MLPNVNWFESAPKSFRVRAEKIPLDGLTVEQTLDTTWLSLLLHENANRQSWEATKAARVEFDLRPEAGTIVLDGKGTFFLKYPCVRCLKEVEFCFDLDFSCRLLPSTQSTLAEHEEHDFEWNADDPSFAVDDEGVAYFENGIIDLSVLLREQLFLDLPMYPACDLDLAREPSKCLVNQSLLSESEEKPCDPRFAKLIDLRTVLAAKEAKAD